MDWVSIGMRIRKQREFMGYTRELFAEKLDVTPKFCSDIELGIKGMSVNTLCRIASILQLSTDYILFGTDCEKDDSPGIFMLRKCSPDKRQYIEEILKVFMKAIDET